MNKYWIALAVAGFAAPAVAVEKPSSEEVRRVMEYYQQGEGAILVQQKMCSAIEKKGQNKNECTTEGTPAVINKGDSPLVWMNFLVAGSEPANVLVQFNYKGRVLSSKELKLSNSFRYRTWLNAPTSKVGTWKVTVEQELENGYESMGSQEYSVVEPAAAE